MWDVWETIVHDEHANISQYRHKVFVIGTGWEVSGASIGLQAQRNVIHFGTSEVLKFDQVEAPVETFLQIQCPRYKDVDVTTKIEILSSANGDPNHWFGIAVRSLRADHWDSYLFYIRQNGNVEFGIKGDLDIKPLLAPEVSSQPVTFRIKVDGNRIQTWVNDKAAHFISDKENEFVRKGNIYLISYATQVRLHKVEIKTKKWYAPLVRFTKRFWKLFVAIGVVIGFIAAVMQLLGR